CCEDLCVDGPIYSCGEAGFNCTGTPGQAGGGCECSDPCIAGGLDCSVPPAPSCSGNEVVTYSGGGCELGLCDYPEASRVACAADEVCQDGTCIASNDPCAGIVCEPIANACDGNVAVSFGAGTCVEGTCEYPEDVREACGLGIWSSCISGACEPVVGTELEIVLSTDTFAEESNFFITDYDFTEYLFYPTLPAANSSEVYEVDLGPGVFCAYWEDSFGDGGLSGSISLGDNVLVAWSGESADYAEEFVDEAGNTIYWGGLCFTVTESIDGADTSGCEAAGGLSDRLRDGVCHPGNNSEACAWDGGDCCGDTNAQCLGSDSNPCECLDPNSSNCVSSCEAPAPYCSGNTAIVVSEAGTCTDAGCLFDQEETECTGDFMCVSGACVLPSLEDLYPDCPYPTYMGSRTCDSMANIAECGWDGGDCCESTCDNSLDGFYECGEYYGAYPNCLDPDAAENDPCLGVTCLDPPRPLCDGNEVLTYNPLGTCNEGTCEYEESSRVDCGSDICSMAVCLDVADPCAGVECYDPPATACDGDTLVSYGSVGTCGDGTCNYIANERRCALGCSDAACGRGPSSVTVAVTCDTYASEASWDMTDEAGTKLLEYTTVTANETIEETLTLEPGNYCVNTFDTWGDGGLSGSVTIDGSTALSWADSEYTDVGNFCFDVEGLEPAPLPPEEGCASDEFEDCDGNCLSNSYLSWAGDGYCDDGSFGLNLNCDAFSFDNGDCD
ncbi:MAG: hypothetical protein VX834_13315, partial [Myxococcota bacterium]|nr:hypothetical protein [Myxococcota bacterium]